MRARDVRRPRCAILVARIKQIVPARRRAADVVIPRARGHAAVFHLRRMELRAVRCKLQKPCGFGLRGCGDCGIGLRKTLTREFAAGDLRQVRRAFHALGPYVPIEVIVARNLSRVVGFDAIGLDARPHRLGADLRVRGRDLTASGHCVGRAARGRQRGFRDPIRRGCLAGVRRRRIERISRGLDISLVDVENAEYMHGPPGHAPPCT